MLSNGWRIIDCSDSTTSFCTTTIRPSLYARCVRVKLVRLCGGGLYSTNSPLIARQVLEPFRDFVTVIPWKRYQYDAYNHFLRRHGRQVRFLFKNALANVEFHWRHGMRTLTHPRSILRNVQAEWVAKIDGDEFIVLKKHDTVHDFLREFNTVGAIALNWLMFDANNHTNDTDQFPPGLVIETYVFNVTGSCVFQCRLILVARRNSYTRRAVDANRHVKTIYRPNAVHRVGIHDVMMKRGMRFVDVLRRSTRGASRTCCSPVRIGPRLTRDPRNQHRAVQRERTRTERTGRAR